MYIYHASGQFFGYYCLYLYWIDPAIGNTTDLSSYSFALVCILQSVWHLFSVLNWSFYYTTNVAINKASAELPELLAHHYKY